jgi:predicted DNA-binding protein (MmcQ/YjbR family)
MGHMFSFFDCNDFSVISLKCQPERIEDLKAQYECIGNPYNESPKHWIGINPLTAPDDLLKELTRNSFEIVKIKHASKREQKQTRLDPAEREHIRPKAKYTKANKKLKFPTFSFKPRISRITRILSMQTSISRMHLKMQRITRARPWSLCLQRIGCAAIICEILCKQSDHRSSASVVYDH